MDYKKKYESVVDRLQGLIANGKKQGHIIVRIEDIENTIPEVQEFDNEKIIKALKEGLKYHQLFNPTFGEIPCSEILNWLEEQGEKKSSDEVLKIRQEVYQSGYNDGYKHGIEDAEQIQSKTKSDWSENDEENLNVVLSYVNDEYLCRWLKDIIHAKYDGLVAWSDDDEYMLNETIQHLEILIKMEKNGIDWNSHYYQRDIEWLKSIKERITSM